MATYHPEMNRKEAQAYAQMGEIKYFQGKLDDALRWIRKNPIDFAGLTLQRFVLFWFPRTTRVLQSALLWILTPLAFFGLYRLFQEQKLAAYLISIVWLAYPLVYYVVQADVRYRYPIHWSLILMAVGSVTEGRPSREPSR